MEGEKKKQPKISKQTNKPPQNPPKNQKPQPLLTKKN